MKKLVSLAVSVLILGVLYSVVDTRMLLANLRATSPGPLALSLVLLLALIGLSAIRLKVLADAAALTVPLRTTTAATFAANALNLLMPAKMGDIAKATMLRGPDASPILPFINLSIYEKVTDIFAVFVWGTVALAAAGHMQHEFSTFVVAGAAICLFFLLISQAPARLLLGATRHAGASSFAERYLVAWNAMIEQIWCRPAQAGSVLILSLAIWAGHFLQIGLMSWALGVDGPWLALAGTLPLVILAGLAPFTFAGIGTRDAAIILLLGPLIGPEKAAALGVLFWLRYLVPGLVGLPLIPHYLRSIHVGGPGR